MAVNNYFRNFNSWPQQNLLNDLTKEVIEISGIEVYYLIRESTSDKDTIYNEEPTARFANARKVEMYVNTPEGFGGIGDQLSRFGLDVQDEVILIVNKTRFVEEALIGNPREGDLIYLPFGKTIHEIKFVEHEKPFYTLGKNTCYELTCELFRYNNEVFDVPAMEMGAMFDKVERENATTQRFSVGTAFTNEARFVFSETITGQTSGATAKVANMDLGKTLDVYRVSGTFVNGETISGATYSNTIDKQDDQFISTSEYDDNAVLETEGDNILDFSEMDPWSEGDL